MKISIANTKFSFKYSRRAKPFFYFILFFSMHAYISKKKKVPDGL